MMMKMKMNLSKVSLFATCPAEKGKPVPYAPKIHIL
jgi:hypothetical protein